ncbi:nucleotide sugar dehydrogenase [Oceanobacillus kapialis]|uniref:Nucleotide sugar dehydrogenase n=1 Tax=Oceanobacillus kapialis TaxID=481353 RepID=A0ABW5PZK6_9BACI
MTTRSTPLLLIGETSNLRDHVAKKLSEEKFETTEIEQMEQGPFSIILFLFDRQSAKLSIYLLQQVQLGKFEMDQLFIFDNKNGLADDEPFVQSLIKASTNAVELIFSDVHVDSERVGDVVAKHLLHHLIHPSSHQMVKRKISFKEKEIVGVVGLGYVGLPVAVGFSESYSVIGFDVDDGKIAKLKKGEDPSEQFTQESLVTAKIEFTTNAKKLRRCAYIIVAVPTPISASKEPDLSYLEAASQLIGENLTPETIVVYESTVYPGATEEICSPILEKASNLKVGKDFFIGYSPERINPGDPEHTFRTIPKIVAGQSAFVAETLYQLYQSVIKAPIYKASSIKVAETAKVVENTQRDINIAFMNELAQIFYHLDIPTEDVLAAAGTKWNFLPFSPGLVGGHCIGVDPYYLIHKARLAGYEPSFLTAAREVNESMVDHVTKVVMQQIVHHQTPWDNLKITVLGGTFKENIGDTRNSKALEIMKNLLNLGLSVQLCDPHITEGTVQDIYGINNKSFCELEKADIVIAAVPHDIFNWKRLKTILKETSTVIDIKSSIPLHYIPKGVTLLRL